MRCSAPCSPTRRPNTSSSPSPTTSSNYVSAPLNFCDQERCTKYEQAVLDRLELLDHRPTLTHAHGNASGTLSARELTVVRYLASRLTNNEIASELFVSTNTLKTHIKRIYQKLGASSRIEAVTEARRLGADLILGSSRQVVLLPSTTPSTTTPAPWSSLRARALAGTSPAQFTRPGSP